MHVRAYLGCPTWRYIQSMASRTNARTGACTRCGAATALECACCARTYCSPRCQGVDMHRQGVLGAEASTVDEAKRDVTGKVRQLKGFVVDDDEASESDYESSDDYGSDDDDEDEAEDVRPAPKKRAAPAKLERDDESDGESDDDVAAFVAPDDDDESDKSADDRPAPKSAAALKKAAPKKLVPKKKAAPARVEIDLVENDDDSDSDDDDDSDDDGTSSEDEGAPEEHWSERSDRRRAGKSKRAHKNTYEWFARTYVGKEGKRAGDDAAATAKRAFETTYVGRKIWARLSPIVFSFGTSSTKQRAYQLETLASLERAPANIVRKADVWGKCFACNLPSKLCSFAFMRDGVRVALGNDCEIKMRALSKLMNFLREGAEDGQAECEVLLNGLYVAMRDFAEKVEDRASSRGWR